MTSKDASETYRIDYMVAIHGQPDGWPEEQTFSVVKGRIEKDYKYDYDFSEHNKELREQICSDIKNAVSEDLCNDKDCGF